MQFWYGWAPYKRGQWSTCAWLSCLSICWCSPVRMWWGKAFSSAKKLNGSHAPGWKPRGFITHCRIMVNDPLWGLCRLRTRRNLLSCGTLWDSYLIHCGPPSRVLVFLSLFNLTHPLFKSSINMKQEKSLVGSCAAEMYSISFHTRCL